MILLNQDDYQKVSESLKRVSINDLFARAVVEKHVLGNVYVDNEFKPQTFYIVHPYGMTLLYGNHTNHEFNSSFKKHALNNHMQRTEYEWMQAYPTAWDNVLIELFDNDIIRSSENKSNLSRNIIELYTRVNFKFDLTKYIQFKKTLASTNVTIVQTNKEMFEKMEGTVIPSNFWNSSKHFLENGIGFSLLSDGKLACTAFSSFIMDNMLELGMETTPEFRGKGFAQQTCVQLIEHCLSNKYEPIWSCRLENVGSFRLAEKLGFVPTIQIPYYRLSK